MNQYMVYFDFTTVRGNWFTGRSGQLNVQTELSLEEIDKTDEDLIQECVNFVLLKKPKWNIFMLNIKEIKPIT